MSSGLYPDKDEMFLMGKIAVRDFIEVNNLAPVQIVEEQVNKRYSTCAYYRDSMIFIDIPACARIGHSGRAWSFPGYVTDRTPFGVLCHELGHHVDSAHGSRPGRISHELRSETKEDAITGYAPNTNEWFAEIFRLFVTNPDLLRLIRPRMHAKLASRYHSIEGRRWDEIVTTDRHRSAARTKIANTNRQQELL